MNMRRRIVVAIVAVAALGGTVRAQSLGELAKKTAAEREKAKAAESGKDPKAADPKDGKPAKVYTDDDLKKIAPSVPGSTVPPATDEKTDTAKPPEPAAAVADATEPAKKGESYWKERMRPLQAQLAARQTELIAAQVHVKEVESFIRSDGTMSHTIAEQLLQAQQRVDQLVAAVLNDKRAIADLEEEARQAGVPPGWLRLK